MQPTEENQLPEPEPLSASARKDVSASGLGTCSHAAQLSRHPIAPCVYGGQRPIAPCAYGGRRPIPPPRDQPVVVCTAPVVGGVAVARVCSRCTWRCRELRTVVSYGFRMGMLSLGLRRDGVRRAHPPLHVLQDMGAAGGRLSGACHTLSAPLLFFVSPVLLACLFLSPVALDWRAGVPTQRAQSVHAGADSLRVCVAY